jgi:hypothetical protein
VVEVPLAALGLAACGADPAAGEEWGADASALNILGVGPASVASAPPKRFGSSARYSPFSTSAAVTAGVSRRVRSISSASLMISGASAPA